MGRLVGGREEVAGGLGGGFNGCGVEREVEDGRMKKLISLAFEDQIGCFTKLKKKIKNQCVSTN
jgi:hypothetical protein